MAQDFATYMTRFAGAQNTTPGAAGYYHLRNDPANPGQNCFAYAVGKATRIDAQTRAQLTQAYEMEHFFPVDMNGPPQVNDAEVYSRPQEPNQIVHAHRVTGATTARSKLGPGELIDHHIGTLQAPRQAGGNTYEYGQVFMRFRRDDAQFNKKWSTTKSGRLVRKRDDADEGQGGKKQKPTPAAAAKSAAGKAAPTKAPAATKAPATKAPATKAPATKVPATKTTTTKTSSTKAPAAKAAPKKKW